MPLVLAIGGMLLTFLSGLVGRALLALGLGFVAYKGYDLAINYIETYIQNAITGMPSSVVQFLGWCWVDKAISLIFSTYTVCITYKLAGSTVLKKIAAK